MKILNNVLISVTSADLKDGEFHHKSIVEIADKCFYDMPELKSVNLPKLKKCGNDCFSSNDKLTTVTVPALAQCGNGCFSYNNSLTTVTVGKHKLTVKNVDGSCFVVEDRKTTKGIIIYTGYNFVNITKKALTRQDCYVAEKETFYAHGETVKQAISDLQFKIVADKLKNHPIKPDTKLTVKYYRLLTGACDFGCRSFMEANKLPYIVVKNGDAEETVEKEPIAAKDLLPILKKNNAYGLEKFLSLITFDTIF